MPVQGNFDEALDVVRELGRLGEVTVVNSINPFRIEGQKTVSFEIIDVLGDAPDVHCIPVGNAGNITVYWRGYLEYERLGAIGPDPTDAGVAAPGLGTARAGRAGAAPRDDRDHDPHRQPGELGRGHRRPRRVRRRRSAR